MVFDKDAVRRQRRRELDARRSKSRVRLGPCLHRWGTLKDRLGFTLHSELAQYLLDSYSSKVCKTCQCSQEASTISASVEMLSTLVVLIHTHSQSCPHPPSLQQQQQGQQRRPGPTDAPPCQADRQKNAATQECVLGNVVISTTPPEMAAAGGEICCLRFACEDGHVFYWWPRPPEDERTQAQGTEGSRVQGMEGLVEGTGRAEAPTAHPTRGPPAPGRIRTRAAAGANRAEGGGAASREGGGGGNVTSGGMRTRSRRGAVQSQTTCPPPPVGGAEEKSGEQSSSGHTAQGTECTEEGSTSVEFHTGSDVMDPESPEASPHRTECATPPTQPSTDPQGRTDSDDLNTHSTRSRSTDRSSLLKDESPQTGDKRKRKATPKEMFLCTYEGCEKIFSSRQYLNHHMKYQHVHQKTFCCSHPSCGKSFNFKKHLKEHEKLHSNQRDYICEFCARAFRTNSNLLTHRRIHTGEKPLQCEVCGFTCNQKASLNWHMKKHNAESGYKFPCDICGRRFEKRDNVTAHRSKSHPDHAAAGPSVPPALATVPDPALDPVLDPCPAPDPDAALVSGPSVPPAAPAPVSGISVPPAPAAVLNPNPAPGLDPDPVPAPCPTPVSPLPPTHSPPSPSLNTSPLPSPHTSPPVLVLGPPASPILVSPPPGSPLLVPPPASPVLVSLPPGSPLLVPPPASPVLVSPPPPGSPLLVPPPASPVLVSPPPPGSPLLVSPPPGSPLLVCPPSAAVEPVHDSP